MPPADEAGLDEVLAEWQVYVGQQEDDTPAPRPKREQGARRLTNRSSERSARLPVITEETSSGGEEGNLDAGHGEDGPGEGPLPTTRSELRRSGAIACHNPSRRLEARMEDSEQGRDPGQLVALSDAIQGQPGLGRRRIAVGDSAYRSSSSAGHRGQTSATRHGFTRTPGMASGLAGASEYAGSGVDDDGRQEAAPQPAEEASAEQRPAAEQQVQEQGASEQQAPQGNKPQPSKSQPSKPRAGIPRNNWTLSTWSWSEGPTKGLATTTRGAAADARQDACRVGF